MDNLPFRPPLRGFAAGQKVFGRHTLVRLLGRGGLCEVWLARDEVSGREVALKFMPEPISGIDDVCRVARCVGTLSHPRIVRVYDFLREGGTEAVSMEYVAGESLASRRSERAAQVYQPAELTKWVGQLCEALEYAHTQAKILHRDLKPANLMVDGGGDLKVVDMGISVAVEEAISVLSIHPVVYERRAGPMHWGPQQLMGEKPAVTDDLYSLGSVLHELLTGKPPFHGPNFMMQILNEVPPSVTERRETLGAVGGQGAKGELLETIPQAWEETIAACLEKDSAKRPQSAAEVWRRLGCGQDARNG